MEIMNVFRLNVYSFNASLVHLIRNKPTSESCKVVDEIWLVKIDDVGAI